MPQLELKLLGGSLIQKGKEQVGGLPSRAAEALFIYLACQQKPVTREKLAELLWADRSPTQSLTNLRTILTALRRELDDYLIVTRDTLAFNPEADAFIDIFEFERGLKGLGFPDRASTLTPAEQETLRLTLDLYRGDFLDGFHLRDGLGFEEWSILERERFKRLARDGFRAYTHACLASGLYAQGLTAASSWLRLDPYDEEACRAQMWLFMRTSQRTAALQTYQALKKKLSDELGVSPASATTDLYRRFQNIEVPPAIRLPAYVTEFVGREEEIAEIEEKLSMPGTRLMTVTGTGGMGKTRLSVEAALRLSSKKPGAFLHGVHFIPLEMSSSADEMIVRIAEGIGFSFHGSDLPSAQLLGHLREQEMLLLLDNFEQLLGEGSDALTFIVEVLRNAAGVKLIVTSRERLNLYEETVFDLAGLTDAVTLFAHCAQRVRRDFALTADTQPHVSHICQLVDGSPLAIELASAWARHLTPAQIVSQIQSDLDFLQSPFSNAPAGHRSLRAVFERSWSLLQPQEQNAFALLSIFRGGFTPEAADALLGEPSQSLLVELSDQSLLQLNADGRYDIHPLLKQYTFEKLSSQQEWLKNASARHTSFYLTFLTGQGDGESPQERAAIRPELDNIRLAWESAAREDRIVELEQTAGTLHGFFSVQSWFEEGTALFQHILTLIEASSHANADGLRCDLLGRNARMHIQIGQLEKARSDLKQAQTYLEHLDDPSRRARVLDSLAINSYYAGDYPQATALALESLALSESMSNADGAAFSLNFLGSCAKAAGDFAKSHEYFERSVSAYRTMQDEIGAAMVMNNLGNLLQAQGDLQGAQTYYVDASVILKEQDHAHGAATTLTNAGKLALKRGQLDEARTLLEEGLSMKRRINDKRGEAVALAGLGDIALAANALEDSQTHLRQALELAAHTGDTQLALDILAAIASLTARQNRPDLAGRLLAYLLDHPGLAEETRQRVLELKEKIPPADNVLWKGQDLLEDVLPKVLEDL
ncbi:MAG TPA: tetratricopeptide repeat protein [Anaerolineales bacterium]|nr:tetratricopeptide repeat protein [Anaerolineales bacterium]